MKTPSHAERKLILAEMDQEDFGGRVIRSAIISPEDSKVMVAPKHSCKKCYGRGNLLKVPGDGYKFVDEKVEGATGVLQVVLKDYVRRTKVPNLDRISIPCPCVFRHARFEAQKLAASQK